MPSINIRTAIILLIFAALWPVATVAASAIQSENHLFDRCGRITWEEEQPRLDAFARKLKEHPELVGSVYVQVAQTSCFGEALSHAIGRTRYRIQDQQLPWNRVAWTDLGYGESFEVSLWFVPAGQLPIVPEYKPETGSTFVEDCEMMRRTKERSSYRAANKCLERTRR